MIPAGNQMISHWWWRPGWSVGKSFYTWHVTFPDGSEIAELAGRYRSTLDRFPGLDVLSPEELHLTVQGLGFVGEVAEHDIETLVAATRKELVGLTRLQVEAGPAYVDAETVQVALHPMEHVADLRAALRRGVAAVWGGDNVPEAVDGFRPHVTLAYSNTENDRASVAEAVDSVGLPVTALIIDRVALIRLHRDNRRYEWDELAVVRFGNAR